MILAHVLLFLCLGGAAAFVPVAPFAVKQAAPSVSYFQPDDIRNKKQPMMQPLYAYSSKPKDTTPVSNRNVNFLQKMLIGDVVLDPDYSLTWSFALLGGLIIFYHPSYDPAGGPSLIGLCGGIFHMLFACLLWVQTRRVRCVFENDSFEFYNLKGPKLDLVKGARLEQKPDNYVSGTINRWKYDTIINYGFFPSLDFPVIVYFKETETPEEQWDKWFAAFDSYGRGQPHFFPGICNARQFKEQMELRGVKRKEIPTLKN